MYEAPKFDVVVLKVQDLITTSDGKGENAGPDDEL